MKTNVGEQRKLAQKQKSRKVWTSLGIGNAVLPFLKEIEQIELQCLN